MPVMVTSSESFVLCYVYILHAKCVIARVLLVIGECNKCVCVCVHVCVKEETCSVIELNHKI